MKRVRVIPVLLIHDDIVYKTVKFKKPSYIGDPLNSARLFNDKEVDELIVIDIDASKEGNAPNFELIEEMASECFMPLCYGGGIKYLDQIARIIRSGVEKISINSANYKSLDLIKGASERFGQSTIVASVDIKTSLFGTPQVYNHVQSSTLSVDVIAYIKSLEAAGAGEILLNFVDRDGLQKGYLNALIEKISDQLSIPLIVCGGAGKIEDFKRAIDSGADAVAAGSMFVYYGVHNAVLINYPTQETLKKELFSKL